MSTREILYIVYIAIFLIGGILPTIISLCKAHKAKKQATTAAEKEAATLALKQKMNELIVWAEKFYSALGVALAVNGESAGAYKKESVMNKLQLFATEMDIPFDANFWSAEIDKTVTITKEVNAK